MAPKATAAHVVAGSLVVASVILASTRWGAAVTAPLDRPSVAAVCALLAVASAFWCPVVALAAVAGLALVLYARRLDRVRAAIAAATSGGDAGGFMGSPDALRGADLAALRNQRAPPGGYPLQQQRPAAAAGSRSLGFTPLPDTGSNAV
jgi:hypothetical protein